MKLGLPAVAAWMLAGTLSLAPSGAEAQPGDAVGTRLQLTAVQNALVSDDRPAFDERLGALRSTVRTGSTALAQELLPLYELASRLWDVQFAGAFFAEDSDLFAQVSQYRGFGEAMRRSVVTDDGGRRFFAAREARAFLAAAAGESLGRAGISTVAVDRPSSRVVSSGASGTTSGARARRVRRAKD